MNQNHQIHQNLHTLWNYQNHPINKNYQIDQNPIPPESLDSQELPDSHESKDLQELLNSPESQENQNHQIH